MCKEISTGGPIDSYVCYFGISKTFIEARYLSTIRLWIPIHLKLAWSDLLLEYDLCWKHTQQHGISSTNKAKHHSENLSDFKHNQWVQNQQTYEATFYNMFEMVW